MLEKLDAKKQKTMAKSAILTKKWSKLETKNAFIFFSRIGPKCKISS